MINEPEEIITLMSSLLALFLFIISFIAYLRERRKKLFLLSGAFFSYALMEFLDASELFFHEMGDSLEILGSLLNFIVLLLFFLSMITKE